LIRVSFVIVLKRPGTDVDRSSAGFCNLSGGGGDDVILFVTSLDGVSVPVLGEDLQPKKEVNLEGGDAFDTWTGALSILLSGIDLGKSSTIGGISMALGLSPEI